VNFGGVGFVTGLEVIDITGNPAGAVTVLGTRLGDTGVTTIDASGVTTVGGVVSVNSSNAVSTAAMTVTGGAAGDTLITGLGNDTIMGGGGGDTIAGGAGTDTLQGEGGNDFVSGQQGNDSIEGGAGTDTIGGGAGNDTITGGAGNDLIGLNSLGTVAGVTGDTALAGAGNTDTLIFEATGSDNGTDTVYGFATGALAAGGDVLNVSAFLGSDVVTATAAAGTIAAPNSFAAAGANVITWGAQPAVDTSGDGVLSLAELSTAQSAGWIDLGNSANVVIAYNDNVAPLVGANDTSLQYVTTDVNGTIASVALVGVIAGVSATTLADANFA
jgi:hypothetical protein